MRSPGCCTTTYGFAGNKLIALISQSEQVLQAYCVKVLWGVMATNAPLSNGTATLEVCPMFSCRCAKTKRITPPAVAVCCVHQMLIPLGTGEVVVVERCT